MRASSSLALLVAAALLASCGKPSPPLRPAPVAPVHPAAAPAGDFPLGQEWVKTMLDENEQTISTMRENLDRIRRELDRMEAAPDSHDKEVLKQSMLDALERQERELGKLNEQTGEMRKVLTGATPTSDAPGR